MMTNNSEKLLLEFLKRMDKEKERKKEQKC